MCREIQMGVSAAMLAAEDAALVPEAVDPDRLGVVFGSEMFYGELEEIGRSVSPLSGERPV